MHRSSAVAVVVAALVVTGVVPANGARAPVDRTLGTQRAPGIGGLAPAPDPLVEAVADDVIVRYRPGRGPSARAAARARVGARPERAVMDGVEVVRVPGDARAAAATLAAQPDVLYAEPNRVFTAAGLPDDPNVGEQWALENTEQFGFGTADADIDAAAAWDTAHDATGVVVAVVDSGIDLDHPDLASRLWTNAGDPVNGHDDDGNGYVDDNHGWDFVTADRFADDKNGHGTHVAGIIGAAGDNATGTTGVAWDVRLMPLRVLNAAGNGSMSDIATAFDYAGAMGAHVVNASIGARGGPEPQVIHDAIAAHPNTTFVFAAGNEDNDNDVTPTWPCDVPLDNVVCVAASDEDDARPSFSNYGDRTVDLAAPGVDILSTSIAEPAGNASTYALVDSPAGNYANDTTWSVERDATIDLSASSGCWLQWDMKLDTEYNADTPVNDPSNDDWLYADASTDGTTWTRIRGFTGDTGADYVQVRKDEPVLTAAPLADVEGAAPGADTVHIRFRLVANDAITYDGVAIDNVAVTCATGPGMAAETFESGTLAGWSAGEVGSTWGVTDRIGLVEYMNGTSMASPFVAGAAALVWGQKPGGVARAVWADHVVGVLHGGVEAAKPWMTSKLAWGGRLNLRRTMNLASDITPPTGNRITAPAGPFQKRGTFGVTWTATDADSGRRSNDVRYRRARYDGGFGAWTRWRTDAKGTARDFTGTPGSSYCFDTRGRDKAFNVSPWGPNRCTVVPLNDRSLDVARGSWSRRWSSGAYRGTYSRAAAKGSKLVIRRARFTDLALVATTCGDCGKVRVLRGSTTVAVVDLHAAGFHRRQIIPLASYASRKGPTTLTIKVISSGERVMIEGLGVGRA